MTVMNSLPWKRMKQDKLMDLTISRLGLTIAGSALEPLIARLYSELEAKGLSFKPPCFLADEWFCPVGVPAIGIPFYLSHPRLRRLEKEMILEVEGGSTTEFLRLMRHETGHAYSYAYGLYRKSAWRKIFGSASMEYPDTYHPRPYSRSYVVHLENWYAQSHPDEDFAETFAVWLTPGLNWRKKYKDWKALEKLEFVDKLMKSLHGKAPSCLPPQDFKEFAGLDMKLKTYFRKKMKAYEEEYPHFYDRDLRLLFTDKDEEKSAVKAVDYLKKSREKLMRAVAFWTKEKRYTIDQLMQRFIARTGELGLYVREGQLNTDMQAAAFVTTLVSTYLFTGKFKRSK